MIRVQLGAIWVFLRTMKRGYLENDQVEPGVCRGGGISQRSEVLQVISNSQLETPAMQQSCLAVRGHSKLTGSPIAQWV